MTIPQYALIINWVTVCFLALQIIEIVFIKIWENIYFLNGLTTKEQEQ